MAEVELTTKVEKTFKSIPVFLTSDKDDEYIEKTQVKAACDATVSALATEPVKNLVVEVAKEVAEEMTKKAVKETAEELAEEIVKKAAKETLKKRALSGAQAGFVGGAFVEAVSLTTSVYIAKGQKDRGEITEKEFRQHVTERTVASTGSVAGSTIGGTVGTVLIPIPIVGTFAGSLVGGYCGELVGKMIGQEIGRAVF